MTMMNECPIWIIEFVAADDAHCGAARNNDGTIREFATREDAERYLASMAPRTDRNGDPVYPDVRPITF